MIHRNDNLLVSLQNSTVSVVLAPIVDGQSHGQGVLAGHRLTVMSNGNGAVRVLDSHRLLVATVEPGTSKMFKAAGNECGNDWIVLEVTLA
jgi:hypothetical protein